MKKIVTALALTAIVAGSVSAREFTPFSGTPAPEPESGSDLCLEYDGGPDFLLGFGSYYSWSQNTVVHFATPAGGPWTLNEAQYYFYGAGARAADVYTNTTGLDDAPTTPTHTSVSWTPSPAPVGFESVDVSSYGIVLNEGDLFGVGSALLPSDVVSLFDGALDGNLGHSWSLFYGTWYNDGIDFGYDDGVRACLTGDVVPTNESTWGGIKSLYR